MQHDRSLGARLKQLRKEQGIKQRELAERAGLTPSFLSQVERGVSNLSINSLRRLIDALGVSQAILFDEQSGDFDIVDPYLAAAQRAESPIQSVSPVVRAGNDRRPIFPASAIEFKMLVPDLNHPLEAILGRLSPGTGNLADRLHAPADEFIYVLSGKLLVGVDEEEYILTAGDAISFKGISLTRLECADSVQDSEWITVITPPISL